MTNFKRLTSHKIFIIFIVILVLLNSIYPAKVLGEVHQIEVYKEKLSEITEEEKKVLDELFTLTQEINELEKEEESLTLEINELQNKKKTLEDNIEKLQKEYDSQLDILELFLVNYQKKGPASYIDALLKSGDLRTFLRSINILRDLSHNVDELLRTLEEGKNKLEEENIRLTENVNLLSTKEMKLKEYLAEKLILKEQQENTLNSLKEQRTDYEEQLHNIEDMWEQIKELFPSFVDEFTKIVNEGNFTLEDLNLKFTFLDIKGALYDTTLNEVLKEHSKLTLMQFYFQQDKVILEIPDLHVKLSGYFIITDGISLEFIAKEGSFYDLTLEEDSLEDLFEKGNLILNFDVMTEGLLLIDIKLNSVTTGDGYLDFGIIPIF